MPKKQFHKPKTSDIIAWIANAYKIDPNHMVASLCNRFPELRKQDTCANCGASMVEYMYILDSLDALLIYSMAQLVKKKMNKGLTFQEANKTHVQTEVNRYYSVPSRTTQCSKLGLITKVIKKNKQGKPVHDQKAGWLITKRGFEFLKGEPVPARVRVFRNQIQEHFDELITIEQAFERKGKSKGLEIEEDIRTYRREEWGEFCSFAVAGFNQGQLFGTINKESKGVMPASADRRTAAY